MSRDDLRERLLVEARFFDASGDAECLHLYPAACQGTAALLYEAAALLAGTPERPAGHEALREPDGWIVEARVGPDWVVCLEGGRSIFTREEAERKLTEWRRMRPVYIGAPEAQP